MKIVLVTCLGDLSRLNAILIPRISAHPPILAQCKVHRPWALFREGTIHVDTAVVISSNTKNGHNNNVMVYGWQLEPLNSIPVTFGGTMRYAWYMYIILFFGLVQHQLELCRAYTQCTHHSICLHLLLCAWL